ncbi:hypothetical protein AMECASPLE_036897, partial [Ameca splendens]
ARILHQMTSDTYQRLEAWRWFGLPIWRPAVGPKIVIQGKSHLLPGQCWAFAGSQGHLSIALSHKVSISHVSMGHIPKMVSPTGSISSAPREFSVYGKKYLEDEESLLGTFLYDEDGDHLQTFKLPVNMSNLLIETLVQFLQKPRSTVSAMNIFLVTFSR